MEKEGFLSFLNKSIGCKVEIINKSGINKGVYASSLLDLNGETIGIAQPMHKGTLVQMAGMELIMNVKADDFFMEVPVFSRETKYEGNLPILWVEIIGEANKVQRRNFVRIPCLFEASCCFLEVYSDIVEDELPASINKEWVSIIVNNISLGGISAKIKQGFQNNFYKKCRYLLAINLGAGLMFVNLLMRNVTKDYDDDMPNGAFAFGGLSAYQNKIIGNYVRRQELAGKQING